MARPRRLIFPPFLITEIICFKAAPLPDISRPTSKPSTRPCSFITVIRSSFAVFTAASAPIFFANSRRASWISVMITRRAPAYLQMATAMMPMGPAPVIRTSSPTRSNIKAVWVAFPTASNMATTSSSMLGSMAITFVAGMHTYSANAPSRSTPTLLVSLHHWMLPLWQLRQWPQVMWPSPDTRWPTVKPVTPAPNSAISPTYSCPITIGGLMCWVDHSFQS